MVDYIDMRKELDDIIINFFQTNEGKAFTLASLVKELKNEITNLEMGEFFQKYTEGVLNRLAFSYQIDMHDHEGNTYYSKIMS